MKATILLLIVLMVAVQARAAEPGALRILFVGSDPAKIVPTQSEVLYGTTSEREIALKKERTPAFEQLLRQYFSTVQIVYAADYREAMSADHDVTIFDERPPAIRQAKKTTDPATGKVTGYELAEYLTPQFSAAALLISTVGAQIAEPLEYKIDYLCKCLQAQAHGMKLEHAVFNTPFKVTPTIEYYRTPENYSEFYEGRNLPKMLPMWRVQKEGYEDGKGYPAGLVSNGDGFTDGGDAEVISNGVNAKKEISVALGRHGNFFLWGFSASPQDMTDEAKLVFVNAVYYIAKFKGARPYSHRPYRSAWNNRAFALDRVYYLPHRSYAEWVKQQKDYQTWRKNYVRKARDMGIAIPDQEVKAMSAPMPKLMDREHWLKNLVMTTSGADAVTQFGTHLDRYLPYYVENLDYLVPGTTQYTFEVDEDAHSLGIANNNAEILEMCVAMLESNLDTDKALRILTRYTGERFNTAQEWRSWLDRVRSRLYFSDEDGFRFHERPLASAMHSESTASTSSD